MADGVGIAALIFALAALGLAIACAVLMSKQGLLVAGTNLSHTLTVSALKADSIATTGPISANSATIGSINCANLTSSYAIYVNDVAGKVATTIYNDSLTTGFITASGLTTGTVSATSVDASYELSVGDITAGKKAAGVSIFNGEIYAAGSVTGNHNF
jgi:hypothetical protein